MVIVGLVAASLVSWWYWPRGDARFVGKWSVTVEGNSRSYFSYHFRADGTGVVVRDEELGNDFFFWQVEGNKLVIGRRRGGEVLLPVYRVLQRAMFAMGYYMELAEMQYPVISARPDEIRLGICDGSYILRRIPE
ncbi:hypothetical protein AYO47_08560 [Planctomyces sp. SCGC AG-212-M04]|nr:hypothetical protein AYO47_08560 [Planctomyces sp. SCGC AG-212-M04]